MKTHCMWIQRLSVLGECNTVLSLFAGISLIYMATQGKTDFIFPRLRISMLPPVEYQINQEEPGKILPLKTFAILLASIVIVMLFYFF